jgi:hypothetical protein
LTKGEKDEWASYEQYEVAGFELLYLDLDLSYSKMFRYTPVVVRQK